MMVGFGQVNFRRIYNSALRFSGDEENKSDTVKPKGDILVTGDSTQSPFSDRMISYLFSRLLGRG
jgi:DNA-directed RNA polymerase specialized sigma54-like protein